MAVDETTLDEFLGRAVGDLGAAISAAPMLVGIDSGSTANWRRAR